ncbi:hypothetical protein [Nocardia sp. NPDC050793]|uniref:hypothetical protein n=1 Tax=Nocardia sp. NPDC050793 TaxID=3155159 RepID=UPI0033D55F3D
MIFEMDARNRAGREGRVQMREWMIRVGLGVVPVLVVAAAGVAAVGAGGSLESNHAVMGQVSGSEPVRLAALRTIVAVDGKTQVTVPDGWGMSPQNVWGKGETLQVADSRGSGNLLIAPQHTRNDFATFVQNVRANLVSGRVIRTTSVSEDHPMTVGGKQAVQWDVAVSNNGLDGVGWMTAVAGDHSYYLVFGFTSPDRADTDKTTIQNIIASFQECP